MILLGALGGIFNKEAGLSFPDKIWQQILQYFSSEK